MKMYLNFLVLLLLYFNSFGQKEYTAIEIKFNPSKSFQNFKNNSHSLEDTLFKKASSYEVGIFVKQNYSDHFSVATGIVGLKQKIKIERQAFNKLQEIVGHYDENQIYDYFIIPLVFSYYLNKKSGFKPYISLSTDHQFIIRYIEKYKDLPEETIPELKEKVLESFKEIKDTKTTIFNLELGLSLGTTYQISEKTHILLEPNYLISLRDLKEIEGRGKIYLNKLGCRFGFGYRIL